MLTEEERGGLTMWGETISAQVRPGGLALHIRDNAPRSTEDGRPAIVSLGDVNKLAELIEAAREREAFMPYAPPPGDA